MDAVEHAVLERYGGDEGAIGLVEDLPAMLLSLLERRYLASYDPVTWRLSERTDDGARPLLREVVQMGRPESAQRAGEAMTHVLSSCHDVGHALVYILHGDGLRHRLH